MNNMTIAIISIVAVLILLAVVYLIRVGSRPEEGGGTASGIAAAVEDVAGELLGVDAHADIALPPAAGPADPLTLIKGLGPKASELLAGIGITRFDQLAALTDRQQAALDEKMGAFKGRLARDRWVEQAQHLASGDNAAFEAKFGKLGG